MATVPTYSGPQLRDTPQQGGFLRAPDVSSDLMRAGQGLASAGAAIDHIALRDDKAQADTVEAKITADWLKWDAENRNKYRGQNVDGYAPAAEAWWKQSAETYGQELNPRAKMLASKTLLQKQNQALSSVLAFTGAEKERHADEAASANITSTIQFGVTTGDVAGAAEQVRSQVAAVGARKGWTTEQVQAEQLKNLSALHLAQITKLANLDADKAMTYYQGVKGEVAAQNQPRIEEILKGESDNQFSMKFAADNAALPLAEQLTKAGEITDPERRKKVITQVKLNHAAVREAEAEKERQASDQAWQLVGQGKRVPEAILSQMDGKGRVQLQEHLADRADRLAKRGNTQVKTNPEALARVYDMMRDDPDGFKKLRMESLTNTFAPNDIEQVARIQRDMLKPDKERDVATTMQLLGNADDLLPKDKRGQFKNAALDEINRFEREKGKPPTYEEKRKIIDRMLIDGEVLSGSWYLNDPNKKFYDTTPEERKRFAPTISSDDRKALTERFAARGVAKPTEEQILQAFKAWKGL